MASILRQIVAGPRLKHSEAGLDLCYVTDHIIATSGPSSTYPQKAYRNPTDELVKFLDYKHGEHWAIWEFRAEGTGYPDSEVHNRIHHYPWPDHHPPPFALIPNIMASMRNWLQDPLVESGKRVAVVHCKAGKGRSGTVATSYLVSEEGWERKDALQRFTERRMRPSFGQGVSIPSQLRWTTYVDTWTKIGKVYLERPVEIVEIHVWGLKDGVKVAVDGYIEEGRKIKTLHVFKKHERYLVDSTEKFEDDSKLDNDKTHRPDPHSIPTNDIKHTISDASAIIDTENQHLSSPTQPEASGTEVGGKAVIFRPTEPILVPTSDVCIDIERRNRATYGWTMVSAVAHVWFNVFFEGMASTSIQNPPSASARADSGVFEIEWDALDGLKGSSKKGIRAFDKMAVIWRVAKADLGPTQVITQPKPGEAVPEGRPADWKGEDAEENTDSSKKLGLRNEKKESADVSRANSVRESDQSTGGKHGGEEYEDAVHQVKSHGIDG